LKSEIMDSYLYYYFKSWISVQKMSDNFDAPMVGNFDPMPKASIGNYKGVMLCNRPNEFGQQRRPEPTGPRPFNSRVDPKNANPTGWNPC